MGNQLRQRTSESDADAETRARLLAQQPHVPGTTKRKRSLGEKLATRITSVVWLFAAILAGIYSEIVYVHSHEHLNRTAAYMALTAMSLSVGVFLYLAVYLPYVVGQKVDFSHWQRAAPRAIPFASACGVAAFVATCVAVWPIYHVLAVPLIALLFIGFVVETFGEPRINFLTMKGRIDVGDKRKVVMDANSEAKFDELVKNLGVTNDENLLITTQR
ncbi:hypothetical protein H9P43_002697 [Blastocladiella emersonii ATCC 22665]|nr:hypothetical protein H9P43_002697 [Blastocladiella emersonii ATCC 22665]